MRGNLIMKWKIFIWLFRNEVSVYEKVIKQNELKYKNEIKQIENKLVQEKQRYELVKRIFTDFKNSKIIGVEINRSNEEVLVVEVMQGKDLWIMLYAPSYIAINQHPRIMSTTKKDYSKNITHIYIDDIQTEHINCGNGSIMMKYFIEAAKKTDATYISGAISSEDINHFDRLEYYYKKFGYDVHFNDDRTSGGIKLDLKQN